jgi:hypothetical protein
MMRRKGTMTQTMGRDEEHRRKESLLGTGIVVRGKRRESCQGTVGSGAMWEAATRTWDKRLATLESVRKN